MTSTGWTTACHFAFLNQQFFEVVESLLARYDTIALLDSKCCAFNSFQRVRNIKYRDNWYASVMRYINLSRIFLKWLVKSQCYKNSIVYNFERRSDYAYSKSDIRNHINIIKEITQITRLRTDSETAYAKNDDIHPRIKPSTIISLNHVFRAIHIFSFFFFFQIDSRHCYYEQ